jgi:hypothetical protein
MSARPPDDEHQSLMSLENLDEAHFIMRVYNNKIFSVF